MPAGSTYRGAPWPKAPVKKNVGPLDPWAQRLLAPAAPVATSGGGVVPFLPPANVQIPTGINYRDLITSDPEFVQTKGVYDTDLGTAGTSRREAVRRGLIRYGVSPKADRATFEKGDTFDDITDVEWQAAQNNPHSVFNRLAAAYRDNLTSSRNNFEDRGFADSGFRVAGDEFQGNEYSNVDYDAVNQLTDLIGGAMTDYGGAVSAHARGLAGLTGVVGTRLSGDANLAPSAEATLVPGSMESHGQPVYRSADGRLWNQDGSPYVPAPAPPVADPDAPPPLSEALQATPPWTPGFVPRAGIMGIQ